MSADPLVIALRRASAEFGCRFEVSSDPKFPVSASTQDRTLYGFGDTLVEAATNLRERPNRLWEKKATETKESP